MRTAIGCVLLGDTSGIPAGSIVHGTGEVARVPVGEACWAAWSMRLAHRSMAVNRSRTWHSRRSSSRRRQSSIARW